MFQIYAIAVIGLLGAMSPGPDFAVVTKNALTQSRIAGYFTTLGIATSLLMHSTYCVIGLAVVIAQSPFLFRALHIIGAAYLIYLGIKSLRVNAITGSLNTNITKAKASNWQAFKQGFLVNALNPKCILFLLTLFSTVIKPDMSIGLQVVYVSELIGTSILWFCTLTFLLTHHKINAYLNRFQNIVVKCLGIFLIGFGLSLLVELFYKIQF